MNERELRDEALGSCPRPDPGRHVEPARPRDAGSARAPKEYLEANGIECELVARDPDRANLDRADPGHGRGADPGPPRPHRRRPGRRAGLEASAVRRPRGRRGLPLGPRRRRHEERDGDESRRDGGAGALGLPAARRPRLHRRGRRGGRHRAGRPDLARRRATRPRYRLRPQRGRRRAARRWPTGASSYRSSSARRRRSRCSSRRWARPATRRSRPPAPTPCPGLPS